MPLKPLFLMKEKLKKNPKKQPVLSPTTNPQENTDVNACTSVKGVEEETNVTATQAMKCSLTCCNLAFLKIAYITCTFVMSIFFIICASFLHPLTYTSIKHFGTWFYIAMCAIDLIIRMSLAKLMETVAAAVSLTGAIFWFIGSCFLITKKVSNPMSQVSQFEEMNMNESFLNLFKNTLNEGFYEPTRAQAWSALWIVGSLYDLYTFIYDLYIFFQEKERPKPLFKTSALAIGIMANIFFLGGAPGYVSHTNAQANGLGHTCTVYNSAGVLIAGSIMYFIYGILMICESKMGNLSIAIVIS